MTLLLSHGKRLHRAIDIGLTHCIVSSWVDDSHVQWRSSIKNSRTWGQVTPMHGCAHVCLVRCAFRIGCSLWLCGWPRPICAQHAHALCELIWLKACRLIQSNSDANGMEWAMHDEASQRRRRTENLYSTCTGPINKLMRKCLFIHHKIYNMINWSSKQEQYTKTCVPV